MKYDIATPYTAVYILVEREGKYAFLKRANTSWRDGYYGLPAGKVEKDESFWQAAVREAKEEIAITVDPKDLQQVLTSHRNEDGNVWVDVAFVATAWQGDPRNAEPEMHSEMAWFAPDDLPENTIPSLRYMLEQIQAGKHYCEYGWEKL